MGVLNCDRINCDNIMCDTYVHGVGYICNRCIDEFKTLMSKKYGSISLNEASIKNELILFLETFVGIHSEDRVDLNSFFEKYSR